MSARFTVHQVRLGLATNSSSSHSLIILPEGAYDNEGEYGGFGWDFFTAASPERKRLYLACQLRDTMRQVASGDVADAVAFAWTGTRLSPADDYEEYVDHQSQWTLPLDWSGKGVDKAFFEDLSSFLMRDEVIILGGNDNTEERHPLDNGATFTLGVPYESDARSLVCRKDGEHWILFNRSNGTKVRMSFSNNGQAVDPVKGAAPELIDIKITDFCPYNCAFCYQDSTTKGAHADRGFISELASSLEKMRVFEVALGGGEPTLHPDFLGILETFRRCGIVPNFTTKNLTWLNDHSMRAQVLEHAGAFAFSVEEAKDIEKLASLRDIYDIPSEKLNCQYVMGSSDSYQFERMLSVAATREMRITLLGYKTNGRGSSFKPKDYTGWMDTLKRLHKEFSWRLRIGIDTALAQEYQSQLADLGIPKWCYEVEEGKFSMYVDAVAKKSAKSSYGPSLTMRPLNGRYGALGDEILQHFAQY